MSKIVLSTESVADLQKDFIDKYQIQIIPMHVIMDGKDYLESELSVEEVYDYHNRTKKIPTTTSTNEQEYHNLFSGIREKFPDSIIIHLGYTSRSSGSFQNALMAAQNFENLFLIDTLNVTGGLATIVMYAAKLLRENPTIDHIDLINKIESIASKTRFAFIPDSLEFLRAGGRVSNIAFIGGSLLKIKPCIELKEGKLVPTRKYRGNMSKVAEKLIRDFLEQYNIDRQQLTLIYSVGLDESIKRNMEKLAKENGFENVAWIQGGPTISTHSGPGCFGISGIEI
ncbi:DegV family protein [uncultured Rummeliibacillus sp.]|uniref:DegV family protein n=1 Tax=uncultured Rummeliibacillus sp. TaxID=762292 RepID=UPI002608458A|nr:DegV family protein [uncultured Rummeliibacillus sp.]